MQPPQYPKLAPEIPLLPTKKECVVCGIRLDIPMSYCCNRSNCPHMMSSPSSVIK